MKMGEVERKNENYECSVLLLNVDACDKIEMLKIKSDKRRMTKSKCVRDE